MYSEERHITLKNGYRLWCGIAGRGGGIPLLTLHGGPGAGHDYLEPLAALGEDRPVIFYDQLGCGKSDKPDAKLLWTIERFADEVDEVRAALGLDRVHILGQSWGGWLLIEYLLHQPGGNLSAVLASTSCGIPQFSAECARLVGELPPAMQQALSEHGTRGDMGHPDFQAAVAEFYRRHLCRLDPWPDCLMRSVANLDGNQVYETINGPNEFMVVGNLRYWDRTAHIHRIRPPVLITCGRHDELGPACAETLHREIPGAQLAIFENSSHTAHIEERDRYCETVSAFMKSKE